MIVHAHYLLDVAPGGLHALPGELRALPDFHSVRLNPHTHQAIALFHLRDLAQMPRVRERLAGLPHVRTAQPFVTQFTTNMPRPPAE